MQLEPWQWSDSESVNRVWTDIDRTGFTWYKDPLALQKTRDPVAFCESMFGVRPVRYQKMIVEPSSGGNQKTLPKTMFAGSMHTDCAQLGMPAHVQVMVCDRQAASRGGTIILDMWPVLAKIQSENPALFQQLFTVPRLLASGHAPRVGLTWSLCRGNFVCAHPSRASDSPVGLAYQSYLDAAETTQFTCQPGDVYINNNHRCLHGREAFDDTNRRFIRYLYWFAKPLAAPAPYMDRAAQGTAQFADSIKDESFWVQQHFGVEAPEQAPSREQELALAVSNLLKPTDSNGWVGASQRQIRVQEAMLSAAWRVLGEADEPQESLMVKLKTIIAAHTP
jgi:gamma-butyrobetaine dioxygenase